MLKLTKSLVLIFVLLSSAISRGQNGPIHKQLEDTVKMAFCGATPEYAKKMCDARTAILSGNPTPQPSPNTYVALTAFPAGQIVRCGRFRVYYEDFLTSPDGFADPVEGANRRNTMCAVLSYVQSTIRIYDTIDIFVARSFSASNHYVGTGGTLAFAGSEYPPAFTTTPGIYNGYAYDHIMTGTDPSATAYDIDVTVNFDRVWNTTYSVYVPISYYNNSGSLPPGNCSHDLFTVLLHEITHGMGFVSFITEDTAAGRPAINGNSGSTFTNAFSRFDTAFLYKGNILTGVFTKLVDASVPQIDPSINSTVDPLRNNDIWLYNNGAPFNQPMYSGENTIGAVTIAPASLVTHLNFNLYSFGQMAQYSPGYQPAYVMGPFISQNELRRTWTLPELRVLMRLGYVLNPAFAASTSLNGVETNLSLLATNTPPYRTNASTIVTEVNNNALAFAESPAFDAILTNNNTPSSPALSSITISIPGQPNIADLNGNPISIMPGSLFGIRGVTSGGNNHNLLLVPPGGTSVTYTPVPGFNGIAQFGYYLWDGREKGAFKTFTINVLRGSYAPAPGINLAVNGDFEDGTEVRDTTTAGLSKPFSTKYPNMVGEYFTGVHFSGGHPYNYMNNWWTYGAGNVLQNSDFECGGYISPAYFPNFGASTVTTNLGGSNTYPPLPLTGPNPNVRFSKNMNGGGGFPYFLNLKDTILQYHFYRVEFDIAFSRNYVLNNNGDPFTVSLGFTGLPLAWPTPTPVYQSEIIHGNIANVNTTNTQMFWQHIVDTVQYCQSNPCFTVSVLASTMYNYIDNFSMVEMSPPPIITAVDATTTGTTTVCAGVAVPLHAIPNRTSCSLSYLWNPGALPGQNVTVHPTVTTTYTVTATDLLDPTHPVTDTITIFIDHSQTTATASSYSICSGNSVTLTAAGATTYVWSPGGSTSNPLTVNPTVTTNYIVTGTHGGCVTKDTVTIVVNPSATVGVPASISVCPGTTVGATSFTSSPSGATFTWTNSNTAIGLTASGTGSVPSFTATNVGSSTITGLITVTPSIGGCQGIPNSYAISVKPTPSAVVPSSFSVCAGSTVAATTFSSVPAGATFTWTNSTPSIGLAASGSGNVPSFTAVNSGATAVFATITVTPSIGGCPGTPSAYLITVTPTCSGGSVISAAAHNNTYFAGSTTLGTSGATYYVIDDITVSGATTTLNITSPNMKFAPGKKVMVANGATLNINGAWLHACTPCGGMWDGIYVDKGAHLNIINGSVIEDAVNAVVTTTTGTGTIPLYTINCALFNKNGTAIKIQANANNMSGNVIKNTIVTCRTITTPTPGTFITNFNALKSALNTNSLSSYPTANTLAGNRSSIGVDLTDVVSNTVVPNYLKVGNASGGSADMNFFDNLDFGVNLTNSQCDIKNNSFKNLTGNQPAGCHGCPTPAPYGVGIYAAPQTITPYTYLVIGGTAANEGNLFYDSYRGIEINDYQTVEITNNSFNCSYTPAVFPVTGYTIAGMAIYLKDITKLIHVYGSPSINNWSTGVWFTRNTISTGTLNPEYIIDGNTISANSSGYCDQAVYVGDIATAITAPNRTYVRNNTISDVNVGVRASNIKNNMAIYNNSTIALRYNASGIYAGVWLEGCDKAEVKNNNISSLRGTYGSTDNWELRGIYAKTSTNNKFYCNNLSSLGECLVFEGGCTSATASGSGNGILGNAMSNARSGFMLRASGVIGTQGDASTLANGNTWSNIGLNFSNGQTNVISSFPTSSQLYCQSGAATTPTNNQGSPVYSAASLLTTTGSPLSCPTTILPAGLVTSGENHVRSAVSECDTYATELKVMLANTMSHGSSLSLTDWLTQDFIYYELNFNPELQEDTTLQNFYAANQFTSHGALLNANSAIENLSYNDAIGFNNSFIPVNVIEQNQQTFNSIYLSHAIAPSTYSEAEVDALYQIAGQCALSGGNSVFQSRNLLMTIKNNIIKFDENCIERRDMNSFAGESNHHDISIYPNPSTGKVTIKCNFNETENGTLKIYDLGGNLVANYLLPSGTISKDINCEFLKAGTYQYEIFIGSKSVFSSKLILIK